MNFIGKCDTKFRNIIKQEHAKIMSILESHYPEELAEINIKLTVELSGRLAVTAGSARSFRCGDDARKFYKHLVKMNYRLLSANPEEIPNTYAHELMHVLATVLYGRVGHNWRWKNLMRLIGHSEERCHSMATAAFARKKTRYVYGCPTCNNRYNLTKPKHQKQQRWGFYSCRKCRAEIVYLEGPVTIG